MTEHLRFEILGTRFFSTHHASAADALAGRERAIAAPAYELLVGRARRFTSLVTQMHLEVCAPLHAAAPEPPIAVFATVHGEIHTAEQLIADFRDTKMMSSARFALSVHNTASGMYSVATGNTAPTTTVTGANAIAAGWLEAVLTTLDTKRPVLLSIADESVPAIFQGPSDAVGVAAAFLLGPATEGHRAELAITPGSPSEIEPQKILARAAAAQAHAEVASIVLGSIRANGFVELRFLGEDVRS